MQPSGELRRRLGGAAERAGGLCPRARLNPPSWVVDLRIAGDIPLKVRTMLRGALAAAVTPLRDAGEALDEEAIAPYGDFLAAGGLDGLLGLGTTGEGVLLPQEQRMRAAERFVAAAKGR